jgi:anti-sigma factor RsiW
MADEYSARLATYLDGELSSEEMKAVDGHVRTCPACAADVLSQVQLKRGLQSAGKRYSPSAELRARVQKQVAGRPRTSTARVWMTAATVVAMLLVASMVATYLGNRRMERQQAFGEIADLHVATLASPNPVDVVSSDRHTVKPWFQGKIPFSFNLPELQGSDFSLTGGRVAYLGQAAGAHLIFQIRKHQISVFIFQDQNVPGGFGSDTKARRRHSFEVETWEQDGLRYFVIGDDNDADIRDLATRLKAAGSA